MKFITAAFIVLLMWVLPADAEPMFNASRPALGDWLKGGVSSSVGLIDPSRIKVNHTLAFGASFGSGSSLMQSLYASHFTYRLSNPVTLGFILGAANWRTGGAAPDLNTSALIGGVSLDWRPSDSFLFHIEMLQAPQARGFGGLGNEVSPSSILP